MGCFPTCFTSSSRRKLQKPVAVTPSTQHQYQLLETTEEAVRVEPAKLDDIIKPITDFNAPREVVEEQTKIDSKKKATCDLVEESVDEVETPKEIEPILDSIGSTVVPAPLSYRYENRSNSEDGDESVIDLSGSDLNGDDYGEDVTNEVECSKQTVIQEQESSDSLFSISIDSRKQFCDAEEDEKEVNSPMPKPIGSVNSIKRQHCDSVLNPIENLSQWNEVRAKALPLALNHQEKENMKAIPYVSNHQEKEYMNAEQQYSNIPISPEPTVKLSKHCRRKPLSSNELRLVDQELGVDTSLSSWLVECETTPKSNASDSSVGSLMYEGVSSSKSHGNRPILGAWTSEELKQLSDTSAPNQLPSPSSDQISIIGTVGSYWSHTGQATDSDSSSSGRQKENTAGMNKEDEKVKWKTTPSKERLERVLDMGILGV
ncbi:uncharacterized protein LOC126797988 [Argentina anserina]|uniref:uncharacterized protein LOC126797988 n=1 Tax=Argentina anserina TaxID=57926 RepID=UPI002176306D|nr:uncharacterized protein LOC126797988 [Potentilla anserina]